MSVNRNFLRNISRIIQLTQPHQSTVPLVRIGQNGDGGYVIATIFQSKICLNLGVGLEVSADEDLLGRNFKIYAFDGTVPNPLPDEPSYIFTEKNIGFVETNEKMTNLRKIFTENADLEELDLILIDIEGNEYSVLKEELEFVKKAKQVVIEFHGLELLGDSNFSVTFINILDQQTMTHSPIHVHANNSGGALPLGGAHWPTILEVTFAKNEYCTGEINYGPFPTSMDFPNVNIRPDMDLTPFYGCQKTYASLARTIFGID